MASDMPLITAQYWMRDRYRNTETNKICRENGTSLLYKTTSRKKGQAAITFLYCTSPSVAVKDILPTWALNE